MSTDSHSEHSAADRPTPADDQQPAVVPQGGETAGNQAPGAPAEHEGGDAVQPQVTPDASPSETPGPSESEQAVELGSRLERLEQRLASLEKGFEPMTSVAESSAKALDILSDRQEFDRARELAVEKMNEELTRFRQKGVDYVKKGMIENLIVLYDNVEQCMESLDGQARETVDWLREMLLETLYREDVDPMDDAPDTLDRQKHKVVRTVETDDPDLDRTVARVVKRGFYWHGSVIRREHIELHRCRARETSESADSEQPLSADSGGEHG